MKERYGRMLKRNKNYFISLLILIICGSILTLFTQTYIDRKSNTDLSKGVEDGVITGTKRQTQIVGSPSLDENNDKSDVINDLSDKEVYLLRFYWIEDEIKRAFKRSTVDDYSTLKKIRDYEYRLWDDELNRIYLMLRDSLPPSEFTKLRNEELLWISRRDLLASQEAQKYPGTSDQLLKYTESLIETTKLRTYELVDMYFD